MKSIMQPHATQSGWRFVAFGDGPEIATSLTDAETETLQGLAADRNVLEIGSAWGYSAVAMALAGGKVTAVDNHSWLPSLPVMEAHLAAYGVSDQVKIRKGWSFDELPELAKARRKFGLIFVDGNHAQWAVEQDIALAVPLLSKGGVLAVHDYDEPTNPGVRAGLTATLGEPHELVDTLAIYRGLA